MEPLERLLNLVGLLLETSRPLTFEQIREAMPEAYGGENVDSAKRKFERDKDDLRNYDIPLEMHDVDAWGTEQGYVIPKERYYLPEISFTPEEMAALFVAAQTGGGDPTAEQAVRKLLYGAEGGVLAGLSGGGLAANGDTARRRLLAAADAASRQRRVLFGYRTSAGRTAERHVDAFAMVCRGGHWYLVGHDRERDAVRAFRLSRLTTDPEDDGEGVAPPVGFHAADHVQAGPWGAGEPRERAVIAFSPLVAWWATTGLKGAEVSAAREDGWIEVAVPLTDAPALAGWVLSFGSDAEAVAPEALRATVVGRLERAADA
jgi:proteasome accessory factor B